MINQKEIDVQLKEVNHLYSELESSKKNLKTKLASNLKLTIAAKHIKDIEIMLENPESINQLNEYNQSVKTYIASLDQEQSELNLEVDEARSHIVELKRKLKEDLTSDLAPLIIEQVKLLEEALEKEIIKDLVSANKKANDFIDKSWLEVEEKQAEEERKKEQERIAKEKKEEEESRAKEIKEEEERRAQRVNLNCTYILPKKIQNFQFGYDGKYFFFDGQQMAIGVKDFGPMGDEAEIKQKGKMSFIVDFKQYMDAEKTVPFLTMEIFVDFKKRSSNVIFKTIATGTMDIPGQCYLL